MKFAESKYAEALDIQKRRQRGETINDKSLAGVEGGVAQTGRDAIVFGNVLIQKSMDGKKPTELTRMLISAVPFIQTSFISSSPYIPFDGARDLMDIHDHGMVNFITTVSGKAFKTEAEALEATKDVFTVIEPYRRFVIKYATGATDSDLDAIVDSDYKKITNPAETIEKIIANRPIIVDQQLSGLLSLNKLEDKALKIRYFESIANVKMVDKEVYSNLKADTWSMIKNSFESGRGDASSTGLTDKLKEDLTYYCSKYPNTMSVLAGSLDESELKEYILEECNAYDGSGSEIDAIHKL